MAKEIRVVTRERKEPDLQLIASALLDLVLAENDDEPEGEAPSEAAA